MTRDAAFRLHALERDGHRCRRCGWEPESELEAVRVLTLDHIVPKSKGGRNRSWNHQILCANCNLAKGDADPTAEEIAFAQTLPGWRPTE